ncbi:MAG: nucleoside triphosphate pyrophosphatase [Rhodospirillaceae bacterium]
MAFILASESPRRLDLLQQIGRPPNLVLPADVDETPYPNEIPRDLVVRLAAAKAMAVAEGHPSDVVLGADTVVACGRRILPKPMSETEAKQFLTLLSGRRHRVYGGIAVIANGVSRTKCIMTQVSFKRLSDVDLNTYMASEEWRGKAGAYAIQGRAGVFVKQINGSYSNIVGLCLHATETLLGHLLGPVPKSEV